MPTLCTNSLWRMDGNLANIMWLIILNPGVSSSKKSRLYEVFSSDKSARVSDKNCFTLMKFASYLGEASHNCLNISSTIRGISRNSSVNNFMATS